MPFFSVVIPTYNRAHCITRALDSVLCQIFTDFECIVVDDGSMDNTSRLLSPYEKKIQYCYIQHSGVSKARNVGITNAKGEWIAFLDSDDVWLPEKLALQYEFIQAHPNVMIHQTDEVWIRKGRRVNPMKKHQKKEGYIFEDCLYMCKVSPSAVVVHRSVFEKVGLFDELLPVCEDYDLWLRVAWQYYIGFINKKLIVKYGGHNDQLSASLWGMDRFRVYALCKLLAQYGVMLPPTYYNKTVEVALQKCAVLYQGAKKRSNRSLMQKVEKVVQWLTFDRQSTEVYLDLVAE
ncbi:MAG: glycosyltransferase [Spirochaetes bacterium]|nr:glycosyltransferase [Spirochaetota bacterium]